VAQRRGGTFTEQVVVVGGSDASGPLDSVEIFDPVSGAWSDLPPLVTARSDCGFAQHTDGRLVVGGGHDGVEALYTTEVLMPEPGGGFSAEWVEVSRRPN
jgi:hypothetical protein